MEELRGIPRTQSTSALRMKCRHLCIGDTNRGPKVGQRFPVSSEEEDPLIPPYAQILGKLTNLRSKFCYLANIPESSKDADSQELPEYVDKRKSSVQGDETYARLSEDILNDIRWCVGQLKDIQAHRSVENMASSKFKRIIDQEVRNVSDKSAGTQISDFICATFLEIQELDDLSKERLQSDSVPEVIPRWGVQTPMEKELEEMMGSIDQWGIDIFCLSSYCNDYPLTAVTYVILEKRNLLQEFHIPPRTMLNFLMKIESHYENVPYHSSVHAADVTQTTHCLLNLTRVEKPLDSMEIFSAIIAAAIHDVHHPGFSNQYLINTATNLAIIYNDVSVLENHSLSLAFRMMQNEPECDILANFSQQDRYKIRKTIIDMVLATDMSKHMDLLAQVASMIDAKKQEMQEEVPLKENEKIVYFLERDEDRIRVLQSMIHCADLSNPTKPPYLYFQWVDKIMTEFFQQGDLEKDQQLAVSPMCDRLDADIERSQITFIEFIVRPMWQTWIHLFTTDERANDILATLEQNRQWYQSKLSQREPLETSEADAEETFEDAS